MARKKKEPIVETAAEAPVTQEPKVTKGNHLTVIEWPSGRVTLEWDDAALAREVREAIEAYELEQLKPAVKAKVTPRKKKTNG